MANFMDSLTVATIQAGYAHNVEAIVNDLGGNPIKIKGNVTMPAIGEVAAYTKEVYWNIMGTCLGYINHELDLVVTTPYGNTAE